MRLNILCIAIVCYILLLLFRKKLNFLYYQLVCATIFLFSLSYIQTLDETFVLYIVFSAIPFIFNFKISNMLEIICIFYFGILLILSMFFNDFINSLSIFVIRMISIFLFIYIFKNINFQNVSFNPLNEKKALKILIWFIIAELFITIIAINILGSYTRLMINFQCSVGNISVAGSLFAGYYLNICKRKSRKYGILFATIFTIISLISGTRGYLIICASLLLIYIFFYTSLSFKVFLGLLVILIFAVSYGSIFSKILNITRLNADTGRRLSEDLLVWKYMPNNLFRMFFGYGFGKALYLLPNITYYISQTSNSIYTSYILYNGIGEFHNLFTTIYYSTGLIGIFILIALFFNILKLILRKINNFKLRFTLTSFLFLYIFMLWFRWSATSGILEFATLAYIIKNYEINNINFDGKEIKKR